MEEKYYKVVGGEMLSPCTRFDYSPYLPKGGEPGAWLPKIENAKLSKNGYYVSKRWNMWYSAGARIFEVEVRFPEKPESGAFEDQICCGQIRLLRDATSELVPLLSDKNANIGAGNTGSCNIGDCNSGDRNIGSRNTGKLNLGDFNTGDSNAGIDNVGDFNIGSGNVGSRNKGHSNAGDFNAGSYNSGSRNKGNANSGSFNIGNRNTGNWNVGNCHCGYFNEGEAPLYMFGKPVEGAKFSQIVLPKWLNKPDPKAAFESASDAELRRTLELPNFDFGAFKRITGVSRADFERRGIL